MEPITRTLIFYAYALNPKDLEKEVFEQTKRLLLDYLGVAMAGSCTESAQSLQKMLAGSAPAGLCTVIGTVLKTSPEFAALANGTAAHSVELDDTHQAGSLHPGVVMFSTAIALSELHPEIDAGKFVCAVVAGYEVAARIAMALQPKHHYDLGFHPTATCGVFGAAVTAAKLLRLSEEQMLSAVGIAGIMAAGSLEFLAEGTWTKRLHPGLAAQNGILAAKLAAQGFRGPATILEGRDGFLFSHSRKPRPEWAILDLGKTFEIMRTSVKPHACCRYMQSSIDALIELANAHDLHPEQIKRVEVAVLEAGWLLVCEPRKRKYSPENQVDAQFSMPYGVAIALIDRAAGLDQFSDDSVRSPEIKSLMGKVVLTKDMRIEKNFPEEWPARVQIELTNGKQFKKNIRFPKGDPENPMTWRDLTIKFESLATRVISDARAGQIVGAVSAMKPSSLPGDIWKMTAGREGSQSQTAN